MSSLVVRLATSALVPLAILACRRESAALPSSAGTPSASVVAPAPGPAAAALTPAPSLADGGSMSKSYVVHGWPVDVELHPEKTSFVLGEPI